MPANPYSHLPTVSRNPLLYQKSRLGNLPKMPKNPWPLLTKPGPSAKNTDKFLANFPRIQEDLPRILTNSWPLAEKSWTICQECQQIISHLLRLPRTANKIRLPRMPSLPWLALPAGSFGSLGVDEFIVRVAEVKLRIVTLG